MKPHELQAYRDRYRTVSTAHLEAEIRQCRAVCASQQERLALLEAVRAERTRGLTAVRVEEVVE